MVRVKYIVSSCVFSFIDVTSELKRADRVLFFVIYRENCQGSVAINYVAFSVFIDRSLSGAFCGCCK